MVKEHFPSSTDEGGTAPKKNKEKWSEEIKDGIESFYGGRVSVAGKRQILNSVIYLLIAGTLDPVLLAKARIFLQKLITVEKINHDSPDFEAGLDTLADEIKIFSKEYRENF